MRLLLDTHAFLWYITNDPKLPRHAYDAIRDKSNEAFLSVVSVWEALVKHKLGKLPLPAPANQYIDDRRAAHKITDLVLDNGSGSATLVAARVSRRSL
jgi:PIN domain nuclease of toxin-antitoxin system